MCGCYGVSFDFSETIEYSNDTAYVPSALKYDQDNDKIIRKECREDVLLAQEKGLNTYRKVSDFRCIAAQEWWKENEES